MKRLACHFIALGGVLLAAGLIAVWTRAPRWCDSIGYLLPSGDTYTLSTRPGGVCLSWSDVYRIPEMWAWAYPPPHVGWNRSASAYGATVVVPPPPPAPRSTTSVTADDGATLVSAYLTVTTVTTTAGTPSHHFAGFGWDFATEQVTPPTVAVATAYRMRSVSIPFWFLTAACLTPAAVRVGRWAKHRRRHGAGHCQRCGYDLRASPGRCPECGTVPTGVGSDQAARP